MDEDQVLELIEDYTDILEKQDEIIFRLGRIVKKQAVELAHLRNLMKVEADETLQLDINIVEEVMNEYENMKLEP
jgi:hypothetical protein